MKDKSDIFDRMIETLNILTMVFLGPQMNRGSGALMMFNMFAVAA